MVTRTVTGRLFEADVLPTVLGPARCPGYVPYRQAMNAWRLVMENQPWNPTDPSRRLAGDLYSEVALVVFGPDRPWNPLRLYTAVGSALDWHGIDGWFELFGIRLTLDVSLNPAKLDEYKADVIVGPAVDEPEYRRELARGIAHIFRWQLAAARVQPA